MVFFHLYLYHELKKIHSLLLPLFDIDVFCLFSVVGDAELGGSEIQDIPRPEEQRTTQAEKNEKMQQQLKVSSNKVVT